MLLRNLDPVRGHCNGTRYIVRHIMLFIRSGLGSFFGCRFLAKLWRTHFWEYRRRFCTKRRVSVGIDFVAWSRLENLKFSPINPQTSFFGL